MQYRFILSCVLLATISTSSHGSEPVGNYGQILDRIHSLGSSVAPAEVLVAFDLDDNLLTLEQDLGSEPWFRWQASLDKNSSLRVSPEFRGLLKAQNLLFTLSASRPVEASVAEAVRRLQDEGYRLIIMTSRGPEERLATHRELLRNQMDFQRTAPKMEGDNCGFLPVDPALPKPKPVCYEKGVFMVEGQSRGIMLRTYLNRVRSNFKKVIYLNNEEEALVQTEKTFQTTVATPSLSLLRYTGMDAQHSLFKDSDKSRVTEQWSQFKVLLRQVFPTTLQDIEQGRYLFQAP